MKSCVVEEQKSILPSEIYIYIGPDTKSEVIRLEVHDLEKFCVLRTGEEVNLIINGPEGSLVETSAGHQLILSPESLITKGAKQKVWNQMKMPEIFSKSTDSVHPTQSMLEAISSVRIFKFNRLVHAASVFKVLHHKQEADDMKDKLRKLFPRLSAK